MKHLFYTLLATAFCVGGVHAKIINVPTCSQDDFEHAYYVQSAPGDIIRLPPGTATWGASSRANQGTIYIITDVTIEGAGSGSDPATNTVITLHDTGRTYAEGVVALWSAATFKKMRFIGSSARPVTAFQIAPYNNTTTGINFTGGFRISDITYVSGSTNQSDGYFVFVATGVNTGLIDNCRIIGNIGFAEFIYARGPSDAWTTDNTLGSANNIFVEDCTFEGMGYVCDANSNGRLVIRYNTVTGKLKADGHGLASNAPPRSFRHMEIYGNRWTNTSGFWTAIEIRGGTAMVFDNIADTPEGPNGAWFYLTDYGYQALWPNFGPAITEVTPGSSATITTSRPHGFATGWTIRVWCPNTTPAIGGDFAVTVTSPTTFTIPFAVTTGGPQTASWCTRFMTAADYPLPDQVGQGRDGGPREPAYIFNNRKNGAAWTRTQANSEIKPGAIDLYRLQTSNPAATFTEADVIQSNRDFFADAGFDTNTGVSRGTKAQMLALATSGLPAGYGFWVTDEGEWNSRNAGPDGRLYVWNGSSWTLKYTPYTYPHPLRAPRAPSLLRLAP